MASLHMVTYWNAHNIFLLNAQFFSDDATVIEVTEPSVVVGADTHASGDTVRLKDNIIEYHQSPCYSTTATSCNVEAGEKSRNNSSSEVATQIVTDSVLEECANGSILSTDSTSLLLEKNQMHGNGVDRQIGPMLDRHNLKKTKVSSVWLRKVGIESANRRGVIRQLVVL